MAGKRFGEVDGHVGRRVRERRREIGMSQAKLGNALGIAPQQVLKYEAGTDRVAAGRLWDIADRLDVDVGYFFDGISAGRARKPPRAKPAR